MQPTKTSNQNSSIADQLDRHVLYQKSVQHPESDLEFLLEKYKELKGKDPQSLREDFCGTALLAVEWCKLATNNTAVGVDLCEETLAWGEKNNVVAAGSSVADRIQLVKEDVLEYNDPSKLADIICAYNFSYNIFKKREVLIDYFKNARRGLKDDGILVLDVFGGTEAYKETEEYREVDDENFDYIWEQAKFNPITHDMTCYIHFEFEDGSRMDKAFTYEWRLRTIPELIESLYDAGYSKVRCYWEEFEEPEYEEEDEDDEEDIQATDGDDEEDDEEDDEDDEDDEELVGTGVYYETKEVETQESYISYLVAEK